MNTLASLIEHLKDTGVLKTPAIIRAFEHIDRKYFVSEELRSLAYADEALPIGMGQTISQPFTVAFMLELLSAQKGDYVLDVGSGSGFTTALLADIIGEKGRVIGVEIVPALVSMGKENLARYHFAHAEIKKTGEMLGSPADAPFDKILVSAAAEQIPLSLVGQLKVGGRMVIPVGNDILKIEKNADGSIATEKHSGFVFVPLIGEK
ncbi:MAG: Protein-L-isoaspartate(D-aspartate)O-methyltrans ferase [Parcubacteria group bacterium GW2011_GWA1_47_8]|nr:MAG: Protein-L-isoaspartate(D-aspartate)O-methyltrans ferase [Parcubacteria group bacterium GW2011_GWA1_47_8]KKW08044.1 MAG: Protein-L-isoaspartate(D-aspartate)O-methyltrans ferase [Parcubacteria group bacterium GW2011_GWA2_49_16]